MSCSFIHNTSIPPLFILYICYIQQLIKKKQFEINEFDFDIFKKMAFTTVNYARAKP